MNGLQNGLQFLTTQNRFHVGRGEPNSKRNSSTFGLNQHIVLGTLRPREILIPTKGLDMAIKFLGGLSLGNRSI